MYLDIGAGSGYLFSSHAGTLVIVSHDVAFAEALHPDCALVLPEGRVRSFDDLPALVPKVR